MSPERLAKIEKAAALFEFPSCHVIRELTAAVRERDARIAELEERLARREAERGRP